MNGTQLTKVTGFTVGMSADEARALYASIYYMCRKIDVHSTAGRAAHAELDSIFTLYDLLNENGFDS